MGVRARPIKGGCGTGSEDNELFPVGVSTGGIDALVLVIIQFRHCQDGSSRSQKTRIEKAAGAKAGLDTALRRRSQFASEPASRFRGFYRINEIDDAPLNQIAGRTFERSDVKTRGTRGDPRQHGCRLACRTRWSQDDHGASTRQLREINQRAFIVVQNDVPSAPFFAPRWYRSSRTRYQREVFYRKPILWPERLVDPHFSKLFGALQWKRKRCQRRKARHCRRAFLI